MSEAEFCIDVGADRAYRDMFEAENVHKHDRQPMHGKYVITRQGTTPKKTLYLQDRTISKNGFWTQYLENAFVFNSEQGARKIAKTFKYGNPSVKHIQ